MKNNAPKKMKLRRFFHYRTYTTLTIRMEPLSRSRLLSMRAKFICEAKKEVTLQIISQIYQQVSRKCLTEETKYVHILERYILAKTGLSDSTGKEINITIDDIRIQLLDDLGHMFPDCKIEYVEQSPSANIFTTPRQTPILKPGQDGKNRAIVIDWSMDV